MSETETTPRVRWSYADQKQLLIFEAVIQKLAAITTGLATWERRLQNRGEGPIEALANAINCGNAAVEFMESISRALPQKLEQPANPATSIKTVECALQRKQYERTANLNVHTHSTQKITLRINQDQLDFVLATAGTFLLNLIQDSEPVTMSIACNPAKRGGKQGVYVSLAVTGEHVDRIPDDAFEVPTCGTTDASLLFLCKEVVERAGGTAECVHDRFSWLVFFIPAAE